MAASCPRQTARQYAKSAGAKSPFSHASPSGAHAWRKTAAIGLADISSLQRCARGFPFLLLEHQFLFALGFREGKGAIGGSVPPLR